MAPKYGDFSESDMSRTQEGRPFDMGKQSAKKLKKQEKKRKKQNNQLLLLLPLMMFAGSGRSMLTADNKRRLIKVSQV